MSNIDSVLNALRSEVGAINKGFYPKEIIQDLGKSGFFSVFYEKKENGLLDAIINIAKVSRICGNSGFCAWCQFVLSWYFLHAQNHHEDLFKKASFAEILGGTGLSNPIKSFANIEKIKLSAKKTKGGFLINGTLPWVSNIDYGHFFGAIAKKDESGEFVMGFIECDEKKVVLKDEIKFCALDGSGTKSVILKDYFLSDEFIIANPAKSRLPKIMPGFILLQGGIALGMCEYGISELKKENKEINSFLPKNAEYFEESLNALVARTKTACENALDSSDESFKTALIIKRDFANLTLEIANAVMLALGTKGYFRDSLASKLLLESYFLAIVTPSTKHIAKITESTF